MLKDFPKWAFTMPREDSRKEMPQTLDSIDQGGGVGDTRGVHKSGRLRFGSTRNRPDSDGLKDGGPAADCEKQQVESDRARVDDGWTRLDRKTENKDKTGYKS